MPRSYVLISHPHHPQVLLVPHETGWVLPEITTAPDLFLLDLPRVNAAIRQQFRLRATTLQALFVREPTLGETINLFTVEPHDATWPPPASARWHTRAALADLPIAFTTHRSALEVWCDTLDGAGPPAFDIPWWRRGWFDTAAQWIHEQLGRLDLPATGPVEQVKCWYLSAVLRVPTAAGEVYFKAAASPVAGEIPLTQAVAERFPAHSPAVLSADPARDWILMRGVQGPLLRDVADNVSHWHRTLDAYARIQRDCAPEIARLLRLGAHDLRLPRMAALVEPLIAASRERLHGLRQCLTDDETTRLEARAPHLVALCQELEAFGIPPTLEHGDIHAANILLEDGAPRFFDWSHACVSHPFFCLGDLLADDDWFPTAPDTNARLRDAYLHHWSDHASLDHLLAAFRLAEPLRPLYHALHNDRTLAAYQAMLNGEDYLVPTPTGWSMQQMQYWLADQLRKLLDPDSIRRL